MPELNPNLAKDELPRLRKVYAVAMAGSLVAGFAAMYAVAAGLGADSRSLIVCSVAMALGAVVTVLPLLVLNATGASQFGTLVLAASVGRMLLGLAVAVIAALVLELARRPIGLAIGAGLVVVLIGEAISAVAVLSRLNGSVFAEHRTA